MNRPVRTRMPGGVGSSLPEKSYKFRAQFTKFVIAIGGFAVISQFMQIGVGIAVCPGVATHRWGA